ncbi:G2/M phase-specific E3 ubiquitin-protein ligase-like [Osmerus mordax]
MDMEEVQTIYQQQNRVSAEVPDLMEVVQSDFGPTQCGPAEEIYIDYLDIMPETEMSEPDEMQLSEPDEMQLTDNIEIQCTEDFDCSPKEILLELGKNINYNLSCRFNINRNNVLDGAFRAFNRKSYNPFKRISVKFSDETGHVEEGIDLGGPRRELLSLLMEDIERSPMLAGPDGQKNLALDSIAVREDKYYIMGKAISVSMVHGGPSPGFFSPTLFDCIVKDNVSPTIDDVHDLDLRAKIIQVSEAKSMEELRSVVSSHSDYLSNAGCLRALKCLEDKDLLLQDILQFQVVNRLHGPLERFKEGLRTLGLLEEVVKQPEAFRPLFCSPPQTLNADGLDHLFVICFSSAGSNRRVQENIAVGFWRDYLLDAEEGNSPCSLEKILMFATGCSALPAIGLKPEPSIEFLHTDCLLPGDTQQRAKFPTANTCVNCLRLPLHKDYTAFKYNMDFGICNTQGFGQE